MVARTSQNKAPKTANPGGLHRAPSTARSLNIAFTKEQMNFLTKTAGQFEVSPVDVLRVLVDDAIRFPMVSESFFKNLRK